MSSKKKNFTVRPFEKLRRTIENRAAQSGPPRGKKKEEFTEEELFEAAMGDVQEIEMFRALSCQQHKLPSSSASAVRRDTEQDARLMLLEIAQGKRPINLQDTQEYVEWTNPDYSGELTEQLHAGRFSVQSSLDLHGRTVPEAEEETDMFLREALARGVRCVKIIYGRGLRSVKGPRIKKAVIRRLAGRYRNNIIAYASARQCDGGLGAVYVLLKP